VYLAHEGRLVSCDSAALRKAHIARVRAFLPRKARLTTLAFGLLSQALPQRNRVDTRRAHAGDREVGCAADIGIRGAGEAVRATADAPAILTLHAE